MFDFYTQSGKRDNFKRGEVVTFSAYIGVKNVPFTYTLSQEGIPYFDGSGYVGNTGVASGSFMVPYSSGTGLTTLWLDYNGGLDDFSGSFNIVE